MQSFILSDNLTWFKHARDRMNYWDDMSIRNPRDMETKRTANMWQREMMIAYGKLTKREKQSCV